MTICPNQVSMGYDFDGGFAAYMIVPPQVLAGHFTELHPVQVLLLRPSVDPASLDQVREREGGKQQHALEPGRRCEQAEDTDPGTGHEVLHGVAPY